MHPAVLILILLPGWCLTPPDLPRRLRLPTVLGISLVASTAVGLVLMAVGWFDPWLAVAIEAPLLLVPVKRRRIAGLGLGSQTAAIAGALVVVAVAVALAGEPFDADGDAGVYAISSAHLATSGEWTWALDDVMPADIPMKIATRTAPYAVRWTEIAPGFLVRGDRVVPQFLPTYPMWGAFAAVGDGLSGPLAANLVGVLVLLTALSTLGRRLVGRRVAWSIPVALAASPLLLVFARLPTAETFLAGTLAAWLLASDVALRAVDRRAARVAGGLLAVAVTIKFFAWAVLGLMLVFCLFLSRTRRPLVAGFVGPPLAAAAAMIPVAAPHLANHLRQLMALESFAAALLVGASAVALRVAPHRLTRPLALFAATAGGTAFAWLAFVRPLPVEHGSENNLVELAALLGPLLVAGAVIGWVLWVGQRRRPWHALPALVFGSLTLFIAVGSGDSPWYPFAARRALPITLPMAVVMWASLVGRVRGLQPLIAGSLVVLPVLPALWRQADAILVAPGDGFRSTRDALEEAVPPDAVVLAFGSARRYAAHLALLGDRDVVSVENDGRRELRALRDLAAHSPRVLLLTDEWRERHRLAEIREERTGLEVTRSPPLVAAPRERRRLLLVEPSRSERQLTTRLDVGRDDLLRVAGCYGPEAAGNRATRWTGDRAWILMPSGDAVRFVWSAAGHPDLPLPVEVLANGEPIGQAIIPGPWTTSPWMALPPGARQVLLELRVSTFSPSMAGTAPADHRRLGVRLDVVEIRRHVPG